MSWIFFGYLALTLGLGIWQARRTRSQADFVTGGRRLPGWALALSERATGESAWLLLGYSGLMYAAGLSGIWTGLGCLLGIVTAWVALAGRFRREAAASGALTMPELFGKRYPAQAGIIRLLSTLIIVFFFVFYVAAQFAGAGKTIQTTFGVDPTWGQIVAALVIVIYAGAGGFVSVVAVDVLQSLLMISTLVVAPLVLLVMVLSAPIDLGAALAAAGGGFDSLTGGLTGFGAGLMIFNHLAWFFGYLGGQPHLTARFMGMRDEASVRSGRRLAIGWTIAAYTGVVLLGLCTRLLFGAEAVADSEMILPFALLRVFPWWLAGILLAGAVAAMVSTAQSMLLVAGTAISQDLYQGLLRRGAASDRQALWASRLATVGVGGLGLALALTTREQVYQIVSYAWAGIGCSFGPAVLLTFFWRRCNGWAVVAALVAGLVTTVAWIATGLEQTITARAVTFAVALGAAVLVALATAAPGAPNDLHGQAAPQVGGPHRTATH